MTLTALSSQRKSARYAVDLDIQVVYDGQTLMGKAENMSIGGMFMNTTAALPFGARLALKFAIPTLKEPIQANGQIRWIDNHASTSKEDGEPSIGVGIQFDGLRAKHVWALNKFFETTEKAD